MSHNTTYKNSSVFTWFGLPNRARRIIMRAECELQPIQQFERGSWFDKKGPAGIFAQGVAYRTKPKGEEEEEEELVFLNEQHTSYECLSELHKYKLGMALAANIDIEYSAARSRWQLRNKPGWPFHPSGIYRIKPKMKEVPVVEWRPWTIDEGMGKLIHSSTRDSWAEHACAVITGFSPPCFELRVYNMDLMYTPQKLLEFGHVYHVLNAEKWELGRCGVPIFTDNIRKYIKSKCVMMHMDNIVKTAFLASQGDIEKTIERLK